jgi:recombination protein RecT
MTDITKFREGISSKGSITELDKVWPNHGTAFARAFITYQRIQDAGKSSIKLMDCSQESLYDCLSTCAQLQLMPSKALDQVHFIPRNNRHTGVPDCTLLLNYKGMIEIALRNEKIKKIEARLVKEGELYKVKGGTDPSIEHEIDPLSDKPMVAAYAVATLEGGEKQFITMTKAEIDKIKATSPTDKFWGNDKELRHYNEMATKTVLRRLWKYLPKGDPTMEKALEVDNKEYEGGRTIEQEPSSPDDLMDLLEEKE